MIFYSPSVAERAFGWAAEPAAARRAGRPIASHEWVSDERFRPI